MKALKIILLLTVASVVIGFITYENHDPFREWLEYVDRGFDTTIVSGAKVRPGPPGELPLTWKGGDSTKNDWTYTDTRLYYNGLIVVLVNEQVPKTIDAMIYAPGGFGASEESADKWRYYSRWEFGSKAIWCNNYEQYATHESIRKSKYFIIE